MDTLVAFLFERIVVSTPDILIGGAGGYLIGRGGGRSAGMGLAILVLYGLSIFGTFLGAAAPNFSGPLCGLLSAGLMVAVSRWRRSKKLNAPAAR